MGQAVGQRPRRVGRGPASLYLLAGHRQPFDAEEAVELSRERMRGGVLFHPGRPDGQRPFADVRQCLNHPRPNVRRHHQSAERLGDAKGRFVDALFRQPGEPARNVIAQARLVEEPGQYVFAQRRPARDVQPMLRQRVEALRFVSREP